MNLVDWYQSPYAVRDEPCSIVSDASIEIFVDAPKKSRKAFIILKNHYDSKTNICFLPTDKFTQRQLTYRVDCLKIYESMGLIKPVPTTGLVNLYGVPLKFDKYTYMIAPYHFLPPTIEEYNYALYLWEQL